VQIKGSAYMYPSIRVNGEQYGCGNRLTPEEAAACTVQWDQLRFSPEEFEHRTRTMQSLCAVETDSCTVDPDEGVSCRAGNTSFWVTWEGRMLPCGMMPDPTVYPLKTGFAQAWQELRAITKKITQPAQCVICPKKQICSACAAVRITETGAFDQVPVYMCRFTEKHLELAGKALEERKKNHAD
jgi:radical SAM protein with 4Fe4S-binding SPASM domain